jgi:hypothetical protein
MVLLEVWLQYLHVVSQVLELPLSQVVIVQTIQAALEVIQSLPFLNSCLATDSSIDQGIISIGS